MGEEKRNKIVAAITVNAILLIFIILAVLIAQIVQISVLKRRKNILLGQLVDYAADLDNAENLWDSLQYGGEMYNTVLQLHNEFGMSIEEVKEYLKEHGYNLAEYNTDSTPVLAVVIE